MNFKNKIKTKRAWMKALASSRYERQMNFKNKNKTNKSHG
jgi:hypothetical protein